MEKKAELRTKKEKKTVIYKKGVRKGLNGARKAFRSAVCYHTDLQY